jgi:hypothetical protein
MKNLKLIRAHGSIDQSHIIANPCDVDKKHVSTSYDELLAMPCSSYIDACSTSMSCETNLLKENNELNEEIEQQVREMLQLKGHL